MFRGSPWEPIPGRPGIEMIASIRKERKSREVIERNIGKDAPIVKRAFQIKREDVVNEGITPNCPGCARAITGGTAQNYTMKCRDVWEKRSI